MAKLKTLASCCGHGIYDPTIVVKDKTGNIFEYYSSKLLGPRKRNRYYKKDNIFEYYSSKLLGPRKRDRYYKKDNN